MSEDELTEYDENEKLADATLKKCYEYWQMWQKLCWEQDVNPGAVVWVQKDDNHHMMVFTRGEYAEKLKDFIATL